MQQQSSEGSFEQKGPPQSTQAAATELTSDFGASTDISVDKKYRPQNREKVWQAHWERNGVFRFDPSQDKPVFTIDTPPPTVSGKLHLGHIYSYSHAEILARHMRMRGANVRYPIGSDDNGLPTERLTEKVTGVKPSDVSHAEYVRLCKETREQFWGGYEALWKQLGLSVDWNLAYSTISPQVQAIAQKAFKQLFDDGRIYKRESPALYCCNCETAVAQAEVEDKTEKSVFYTLGFSQEDGSTLPIATTRPEFLAACVAVFVNPEDSRFTSLVGQSVTTPLGESVPVLADEKVDPEKGTGAVMCCTYGDETDLHWVRTHDLPEKVLLSTNGKFLHSSLAPELEGLSVTDARKAILERLRESDSVLDGQRMEHSVGVHERCGTPMEILPRSQWFLRMLDMKDAMIEAGSKIEWHPAHMEKRYQEWVKGLQWDWAISRERFVGIPIPAYHCDSCDHIEIPDIEDGLPIDPRDDEDGGSCQSCENGTLHPEKQVLDTWFTSSLSPRINSENPLNGPLQGELQPANLRPHAHDIIRTWTTYSVLMSLLLEKDIPFEKLMISGHILLRKGEKISKKSGGGGLDPSEVIATHSADAVRYAMCGASLGQDGYFDEAELANGKKLATKIFNAGKFVLGNLDDFDHDSFTPDQLEATDEWILASSRDTARTMAGHFDNFEVSQARRAFLSFFWGDFCDNYIELVKDRLKDVSEANAQSRASGQYALHEAFMNILKMSSPFVPHIAEEMFHAEFVREREGDPRGKIATGPNIGYFRNHTDSPSVSTTSWPDSSLQPGDQNIREASDLMLKVVGEIRKERSHRQMNYTAPLPQVHLILDSADSIERLKPFLGDIQRISKAEEIVVWGPTAVPTVGSEEVVINLASREDKARS